MKLVVAGVLLIGATLAFALPTPKDIEGAVAAERYTQAETMLREVIQEKPQSAKAHYELGQVLAHLQRYKDAQTELHKAQELDPTLKFAASPEKFNAVLGKVNDLAAAPSTSVVMAPSVAPSAHTDTQVARDTAPSSGFPLTYVWLAIGGLVVPPSPSPKLPTPLPPPGSLPNAAAIAAMILSASPFTGRPDSAPW